MKAIGWRLAALIPITAISACGSWAPQAVTPDPHDPKQAHYLAMKAYYDCLDAKKGDCTAERSAMIRTQYAAEDADVRRTRELNGTVFTIRSM